ncbi:hypothetical protein QSJ18_13085 [Gordonia sp. ABSL1-1]|uniref:hypothetical protein n=1 Tax=Gordonia sp. ABSL1-1 TaxID=3053923 RepID=UPI0025723FB9|nr:hypothetical protein [Gordonia sp. ABSL1-1]MDL9937683.1 hypothetical protein [Gordonia sp. ABSL1-1]
MASARTLTANEVGEAADGRPHPVEWWYANLLIDAPGTPVDGMALVTIFSKFTNVIEEVRRLLISPDAGLIADFGSGPLPSGSIRASASAMDVSAGSSRLCGSYPNYHLRSEGESASGAHIVADITYTAEVAAEREGYIDDQFKHWVVYRLNGSGTITFGDVEYQVGGLGYVEHLFGTLGWFEPYLGEVSPPTFVNGWNWYWTPSAGPDGVVVQAGGFVTEGDPVPFASVSVDGSNHHHFITGRFDVLERRRYEGVEYVHKFRLTDQNDSGSIDLTFTRRDASSRAIKAAPGSNKVAFVSGFATLEGHAVIDGTTHTVSGRAFGSIFTVSLSGPVVAIRSLPNAVRVPFGRLLRALSGILAKVR